MKDLLLTLKSGLDEYVCGTATLQDIEDKLTSPIISSDDLETLPNNIQDIVYALDSWDLNKLTVEDVVPMRDELTEYLKTVS